METKDLYFVAVKVFLEDGKGNLLIIKDKFGDWDLPGGRLQEGDFEVALPEVINRKIKEELGSDVNYTLGSQVVSMRHERDEILENDQREKRRIFALGYKTHYNSGEIELGKNHEKYEWVPVNFDASKYFNGGWLKGIQEFQATLVK